MEISELSSLGQDLWKIEGLINDILHCQIQLESQLVKLYPVNCFLRLPSHELTLWALVVKRKKLYIPLFDHIADDNVVLLSNSFGPLTDLEECAVHHSPVSFFSAPDWLWQCMTIKEANLRSLSCPLFFIQDSTEAYTLYCVGPTLTLHR